MKLLKALSNPELISKLKLLLANERDLVVEILWHLREVESRRIHLDSGFPSLFEYCTRELGYSAGAAARRIAAMRLLKELPDLEPKIRNGDLQLSQLAQAQQHFQQERKEGRKPDPDQKREVLNSLEGKTSRETERFLVGLNPRAVPAERERVLSEELLEIRFIAGTALMKKIEEAKLLYSHVNPNAGYAELFDLLLDKALQKPEPKRPGFASRSGAKSEPERSAAAPRPAPESASASASASAPSLKSPPERGSSARPPSTRVTIALRRLVFQRAGGCCEYRDSRSGRRCGSRYQLEVDHLHPVGKGGGGTPDNLRLLCRQHNFRAAEQAYGRVRMERYRSA